jgi:hypothetical protein
MRFTKFWVKLTKATTVSLLVLTFFISGCAHNMALNKGQEQIELSGRSIALLSIKISNQNKPGYQLKLEGAMICPGLEKCHTRPYYHKAESPYKSEKGKHNEYLLSFDLDAC